MLIKKSTTQSTSISFNLETITISQSRVGCKIENLDIIAIVEWLENKDKNKSLYNILKAIIILIKTVSGLEDRLEEVLLENNTLTDNIEYTKIIYSLLHEEDRTEITNDFLKSIKCQTNLDEINIDFKKEAKIVELSDFFKSIEKEKTMLLKISELENENKELLKKIKDFEVKNVEEIIEGKTAVEEDKAVVEDKAVEEGKTAAVEDSMVVFLKRFVELYNKR